jgi:hypothetical protein
MKDLEKLAVSNSLGFKRGETMEDQNIRGTSTAWLLTLGTAVLVGVASWRSTLSH